MFVAKKGQYFHFVSKGRFCNWWRRGIKIQLIQRIAMMIHEDSQRFKKPKQRISYWPLFFINVFFYPTWSPIVFEFLFFCLFLNRCVDCVCKNDNATKIKNSKTFFTFFFHGYGFTQIIFVRVQVGLELQWVAQAWCLGFKSLSSNLGFTSSSFMYSSYG